jgi:hypothetical protein
VAKIDLLLVGLPTLICLVVGALHGSRPQARPLAIALAGFGLSALLCWSIVVGSSGHPAGAALLPAWLVSPIALISGSTTWPSPWLHPWLSLLVYYAAAYLGRPSVLVSAPSNPPAQHDEDHPVH